MVWKIVEPAGTELGRGDGYHRSATIRQRSKACVDLSFKCQHQGPKQVILDLDAHRDSNQEAASFTTMEPAFWWVELRTRRIAVFSGRIFCGRDAGGQSALLEHQCRGRRARGDRSKSWRRSVAAGRGYAPLLRGGFGFTHEPLMAWCEVNRVEERAPPGPQRPLGEGNRCPADHRETVRSLLQGFQPIESGHRREHNGAVLRRRGHGTNVAGM